MALRECQQPSLIGAFARDQVNRIDTDGEQLGQQRNDAVMPLVAVAAIEACDRQQDDFAIEPEPAPRRVAVAGGELRTHGVVDHDDFFRRNPRPGERSGARVAAHGQYQVGSFERSHATARHIIPDFGTV